MDWWEEYQAFFQPFININGVSWSPQHLEMFVSLRKLRYTSMIADGDAKTFKLLSDEKPYGASHPISKQDVWPFPKENGHITRGNV